LFWQELGDIKVLIVEDDPFNRLLIKSLLGKFSQIHFLEAGDGLEAIEILEEHSVDIMLLDFHMPNMNGYETLVELNKKELCKHMAILIMTTDEVKKQNFYAQGTDDFISKPFKLEELEKKIYQSIVKKRPIIKKNTKKKTLPQQEVRNYTKEQVQASQKDFFLKIVSLKTKAKSSQRIKTKVIAIISKEFALKLGYDRTISNHIYYAALIRDIGVIGLNIAGEETKVFSPNDKKIFQEYILLGYQLLSGALETDFINIAKKVILQHKESYDGSGIPYGLQKDEICDMAMIVSLAETFEALLSKKSYRNPIQYSQAEAYTILLNSKMRFNPELLEVFLKHFSEFITLRASIIDKINK